MDKIKEITKEAGYSKKEIETLIIKRKKIMETIKSGQKQKQEYTIPIPYIKHITEKIVKEGRKHGLTIPVNPGRTLYERLRSDQESKKDKLTRSGIYKIDYEKQNGDKGTYIGMTKRPIETRIKEHMADLRYGRSTTAIARTNIEENMQLNIEKITRIAPYINWQYAIKRESLEIWMQGKTACNDKTDEPPNIGWQRMLKKIAK